MKTHADGHGRGGMAFVFRPFKRKAPGFTSCCAGGSGPGPRLPGGWHTHPWGYVNEGVEEKGVSPEKPCRAKGGVRPWWGSWGPAGARLRVLGVPSAQLAPGPLEWPPAHPPPPWLASPGRTSFMFLLPRALGHRRPAFPSAQPGPCVSMYRPCPGGLSCTQTGRLSGQGSDQCCSCATPTGACAPLPAAFSPSPTWPLSWVTATPGHCAFPGRSL